MKKMLSVFLAACLSVALFAGCNSQTQNAGTDAGATITTKEDLVGKKIGVQEGTTGDLEASAIENAEVARFKKALDAAMDVKNGKLDAMILDDLVAKTIVAENPELEILDIEFEPEAYSVAVKKGNTELLNQINETLARIKADGTTDQIADAIINQNEEAMATLQAKEVPASDKTLIMGTNAEFPPFEYRNDQNEVEGYDVEIAKEIARDAGAQLTIEDMAFDSLIGALSSGKIDMILAGMTVTEERQQNVDFSDTYYTAKQVVVVKK